MCGHEPFLRFFPFRFGWAQRIWSESSEFQAERGLDLKGSLSGRTPLERVLMSLSGSLTASGGENGNQFCSVDAGTHGTCTLLFAFVSLQAQATL